MKYKIKCRFCGKKTGEVEISDELIKDGDVLNNETLGVLDARCENCESEHGSFKEMEELFQKEIGENSDDFKETIKNAEYKKRNFVKLIDEKKSKLILEMEEKIKSEKNAEEIPSENL